MTIFLNWQQFSQLSLAWGALASSFSSSVSWNLLQWVRVSQSGYVEWWSDDFWMLALCGNNVWLEDRSDQSVGHPAFCTVHDVDYPHILNISLLDDNIVNQIPLPESWVHLGCFVLVSLTEAMLVMHSMCSAHLLSMIRLLMFRFSTPWGPRTPFQSSLTLLALALKFPEIMSLPLGGVAFMRWPRSL